VKRALFALYALFAVSSASAEAPKVTFISPCECQGFHGKNRWVTKTDLSPVPLDKSAIQSVTPSQIYAWEGLSNRRRTPKDYAVWEIYPVMALQVVQ
jgi:hypothetical protein